MTQLPEKMELNIVLYRGNYDIEKMLQQIVTKINDYHDYLKEREEPTPPTPPEPEWKVGDIYFYISSAGEVFDSVWDNDDIDHYRRDFLGIYRTREEAEAVLVKVRSVVNK